MQVLTRGPVHEAFSGLVTFNPEPGIIVSKLPPEIITEIPPEEMPEGDNVTWIPGYWGWDDEREDFLWVSGIWRSLPPDREWVAGYWLTLDTTYQWTSGYWKNAEEVETMYLPAPPPTLEVGPNVAAPAADYGWSPGNWKWRDNQYAWQPGYWYQGQTDWVWIPANYVWTPGGYVYVDGYWDYPVGRRGVLFAPVYYPSQGYAREGYSYRPQVAIDLSVLVENIFLRPKYQHYYFGDYYSKPYRSSGYYAPYDYQSGRHGYDSLYSHQRWTHRSEKGWEDSYRSSYQNRYDNEDARPYRLWSDAENYRGDNRSDPGNRRRVAEKYDRYVNRKDSPNSYKKIGQDELRTIERRNQDLRDYRKQRGDTEGKLGRDDTRKPGDKHDPLKVKTPKSPMVGKHSKDFREGHSPPKIQRDNRPDGDRRPGVRDQADKTRDEARKAADDQQKDRQKDAERRGKDQNDKARDEARKAADDQQKDRQKDAERRGKDQNDKARDEARKAADDQQKNRQKDAERRGKEQSDKSRDEARKASDNQQKDRQKDAERRGKEQNDKAREEARKASDNQQKDRQKDAERPAEQKPDKTRKPDSDRPSEEEAAKEREKKERSKDKKDR